MGAPKKNEKIEKNRKNRKNRDVEIGVDVDSLSIFPVHRTKEGKKKKRENEQSSLSDV